jgi:diacylglycerol O-acyltransferase / wax synthase
MRRLTGLDASFLYMETPNNHMHVGAVYVFDPGADPDAGSFERVKATVASRLHLLPPFRWKLVEVPFGLHHPLWINDPDFDIEYHVRRAALPAPGGQTELAEYAAQFMARPLDRSRPLWEMEVVEGLAGGRIAMITKTHHSAVDGASGAELTTALLDITPEGGEVAPPQRPFTADRIPSDVETLAYALRSLTTQPAELVKAVRRTAEVALNLRKTSAEGAPTAATPFGAPRTSFNVPITPHRKFAYTQFSLADVKAIRAALGGTVNDVVLAVCASALRRYLSEGKELPGEPLIAMVPMSVRSTDQKGDMGNRVSQLLVRLATQEPDPVARLNLIKSETALAKEQINAIGADTLSNWAEFAAPAVAARAARLYASMGLANRHKPIYNVTISNVPGPQIPLYSSGAKLVEWYPMGPIFDGIGLNMTVMSYMGDVYVGLLACRETVAGLWDLAQYMVDGLDELLAASAPGTDKPSVTKPEGKKAGKKAGVKAKKPAASKR